MRELQRGQRIDLEQLLNCDHSFALGIRTDLPMPSVIDCTCFALDPEGRASDERYIIYFNQPTTPCGGIALAAPADDPEGLEIDLARLPAAISHFVVVATIDGAATFSEIDVGHLNLYQDRNLLASFRIDKEMFQKERSLILVEIYRKNGPWRLHLSAQGFAGGLTAMAHHFGVSGDDSAPATPPRPPLSLLVPPALKAESEDMAQQKRAACALEQILGDFKIKGSITHWTPGPVVTTFGFSPAPGVKAARVVGLEEDLALRMTAAGLRVDLSFIDGLIGIELPNQERQTVNLRPILESTESNPAPLLLTVGVDSRGAPVVADLVELPHLLVAGATRSGKSVALHSLICALLMRSTPEQVRLLLIDPKRLEFCAYEDVPHLLAPVIMETKECPKVLSWLVNEMTRRYAQMEKLEVRNLEGWRLKSGQAPAAIITVIDELYDLMLQSGKAVEESLIRLAQMGRAAGIHLILSTQRPSREVLTPQLKANIPARLAFRVTSIANSNIIIDRPGAENLLGKGDGLFVNQGAPLQRIQAPFVSENEVKTIVRFLKKIHPCRYESSLTTLLDP
ncbi:MAG: TerD family protein [Magnetococcales bacterium]|nr:TerD family protein [Magnetococcales bacterium]